MGKLNHIELGRPARHGQLILERRFSLATRVFGGWKGDELLLDLGCGNGAQTLLFAPQVKRAVGVDITPIQQTEQAAPAGSFTFVVGDAGQLPLQTNLFDRAISFEVLEHVPDDFAAIKEVFRVLKPRGEFIFSVPNKWWVFESHGASVPGFGWVPWNRIPLVGWPPKAIHELYARARIYTMRRALKLARAGGLEPIKWGYITAPLDVLPDGNLRKTLRNTIFRNETTESPLLAVNLYVFCRKP